MRSLLDRTPLSFDVKLSFSLLVFACFILQGCTEEPANVQHGTSQYRCLNVGKTRPIRPFASEASFYFWKVQSSLPRRQSLEALGVHRLYVRYFDVVYGREGPRPVGIRKEANTDLSVIPVVYVTTGALKDLEKAKIHTLAGNIWKLIKRIRPPDGEVQLDCDWTPSTREAYFHLLASLKQIAQRDSEVGPVTISSTIRLHQLKYYRETGVPPADRGALMIYNMGEIANPEEKNSIFRWDLARSYLQPRALQDYPIPLDMALPDFSWTLSFVHGSFHSILHLDERDLGQPGIESMESHRYRLKRDTVLDGQSLPAGAELRFEGVDSCQRWELVQYLGKVLPARRDRRIILFDYDAKKISGKEKELIDLFAAIRAP
ncbi:MAG: hypothetical protein KDK25_03995 [Leptospiraceae bacterium]|nr:hypothetical protein [Leptospiraceae bacterium]